MACDMKRIRLKYVLLVLLVTYLMTGCGYYSFKGALPSHLKTIGIPLFNNTTAEAGVEDQATELLTNLFIEDNTLALVDETKADLLLTGAVVSVLQAPAIVQSGEEVTENKLVVRLKVKCEDTVTGKVLYDKNFEDYGLMDVDAGLDERQTAITTALEQIADKILNETLGGW